MLTANPIARMVNDFLMKMALPLGLWFIALTLLRYAATDSITLTLISAPLILVTPFALWRIIWELRNLLGGYIRGLQAWVFGVQLMLFAGLIEAFFVYIFNEFIRPGNLAHIYEASIAQVENVIATFKELGGKDDAFIQFEQTLETLKAVPYSSPIDTAISTLSNDLFAGIILMIPIALIVRRMPKVRQN